jgi:hypothetical protein
MDNRVKPGIGKLLLVLIVFVLAVVYIFVALGSSDPLWFWPGFNARPDKIIIHCAGQETILTSTSPGYAELTEALCQTVPKIQGFYASLGISEGTMQEYKSKALVVEVFYARPIFIHSPFNFGRPDSLLIPLSGLHSELNVLFGGHEGVYWAGALRLKSTEPLRKVIEELGY